MSKVIELKDEKAVDNVIGKDIVMIKFYAAWCGACLASDKFYRSLPEEYPKVKFYQIDVSENRDVGMKYGIESIPTFKYYRGQIENEVIGVDKEKIRELLNKK